MSLKTQPTIEQFKRWAADVQPAAKAVLMARVFAQMERERVNAYIRPIFESYGFTYGAIAHGRTGPIPTPGDLYLCDDTPMLACFFEDCDTAHRAHGFTGPAGHCPALRAEHLLIVTENALIGLAEPLFGIENVYGKDRTTYLELLIGAALKPSDR